MVVATIGQASTPPQSRGARAIALGNGYTAVAGEAVSLFYNPAGLAELMQKEVVMEYGRSYDPQISARSDFNAMFAMPFRHKEIYMPLAFGVYSERPAEGAHIVEISAGTGMDAPLDRWSKGLVKFPVKLGGAATIRHQGGEEFSNRVGKSAIGLSLTAGAYAPLTRKLNVGFALRRLAPSGTDPDGPSLHTGLSYLYRDYLNVVADASYQSGGIWRFQPGLEWLFVRGVVRPRLGWGYRGSDGIDHVATGFGLHLSPLQIDLTYMIPTKTLTDNSGQIRASFAYRFGRPQFSEIYYDRALEAASKLDKQVLSLTVQEAEMKASLSELEQKRRIAREEIASMRIRIEELKKQDLLGARDETIRRLQHRINALESELNQLRARDRAATQRKAVVVRRHTVKAGETLQSLARDYYGDPNQWKKIYDANTDKIERGLPKAGADLVIP